MQAPEPLTLESLQTLHDVFNPRPVWATPRVSEDSEVLGVMLFLHGLRRNGELSLRVAHIPATASLEDEMQVSPRSNVLPAREVAYDVCWGRRGKDDLRQQSWAAYCYMTECFPDIEVNAWANQYDLPFVVFAEKPLAAVTAGNIHPSRVLRFIEHTGTRKFSVLGAMRHDEWQANRASRGEPQWRIETLEFSARAIERIRERRAQEEEQLQAALHQFASSDAFAFESGEAFERFRQQFDSSGPRRAK